MGFTEKLHRVSFENVYFLARSESVRRGKKVVFHEYPNSDDRYVEELGKLPPTFTLEAVIHGTDSLNKRIQLENVLEKPGLGTLIHPIYGSLRVKVVDFDCSSNQTEIGQFIFNITFSQSRESVTAEPSESSATEVASKAGNSRDAINDALENNYKPPRIPFNFDAVTERLQNIFDEVHKRVNYAVDLSDDGAANFSRVYRSLTNNITRIVSSAKTIRENIALFYNSALDAAVFADQLKSAWDNLIEYPLIIDTGSPITREQSERQQNDIALVEHLRLTALVNSYEANAYTDFTTDTELTTSRQKLNSSSIQMLNNDAADIRDISLNSLAYDPTTRDAISQLIISARKVFDNKEKTIFRVVEINPGMTSMVLTSFRYYGDLSYLQKLIDLNPEVNHANFNKVIKALTK